MLDDSYNFLDAYLKYDVLNYCAHDKVLYNMREQEVKKLEQCYNNMVNQANQIHYIQYILEKTNCDINQIIYDIKPYEFDKIYKYDESSLKMLESMNNAILNHPNGYNILHESNDYLYTYFSSSKDIQNCGHSGSSYHWTLAQLKYINQNGWNQYVKEYFSRII